MPWEEVNTVDLRSEFVILAEHKRCTFEALCRRYNISRKTGYKWLKRYRQQGLDGLDDYSRRPLHQPAKTSNAIEMIILKCREQYPDWGGRKLKRVLENQGYQNIPSPSTITEVLRRHNCLTKDSSNQAPFIRFEHPYPNDLWQMDFKGHFGMARRRCHPLTVLDDHSRYSLCLKACPNEQTDTVKDALIQTFKRYGLPRRMTMDNGAPWGSAGNSRFTQLTVWLIEQGIRISHSTPYHPQTQGKDERFHRTMKAELLGRRQFDNLAHCQTGFDAWRTQYNTVRPHEALNMDTPAMHYEPSSQSYRTNKQSYEYGVNDQERKVGRNLVAYFKGYEVFVGEAFMGRYVAFRPTLEDGKYDLYYCHQKVGNIDLNKMKKRTY